MSETQVVYVFVWHTLGVNPCVKCVALNGRGYRQDLLEPFLVDSQFGPIWDLNGGHSLTHHGCQCVLEIKLESVNIDIPEIEEFTDKYEEFETSLTGVAELFK